MADPGAAFAQGILTRAQQVLIGVIKSLDLAKRTAVVELKDKPELKVRGRLAFVGGGGGDIWPGYMKGDLVVCYVTGTDLTELLKTRTAQKRKNPYLYDKTDVLIGPSPFAENGEPASRSPSAYPAEGEMLIRQKSGIEFLLKNNGDAILKTPGNIYLGGTTDAKKVLVDGDANGAGAVSASQTKVWAGT